MFKIPEDEIGRFLTAYNRGNIFPKDAPLGKCFLLYYGLHGYSRIAKELNNTKALEMIIEEFGGSW